MPNKKNPSENVNTLRIKYGYQSQKKNDSWAQNKKVVFSQIKRLCLLGQGQKTVF